VWSVDAVAPESSGSSDVGLMPMSANMFTVACCIVRSGALPFSFSLSRPHAHCTVPVLNTSAPLGARYMVRLCVAVPPSAVVLP
jgi:hypothetical protein